MTGAGDEAFFLELRSSDGLARQRARLALVERGPEVTQRLAQGLSDEDEQYRWECAKALCALRDPAAGPALVGPLLQDQEEHGIQWIAAEALIRLGAAGLRPLLQALTKHAGIPSLQVGAHHVFHDLRQHSVLGPVVRPVLAALEDFEPEVSAPVAAHAALEALERAIAVPPAGENTDIS